MIKTGFYKVTYTNPPELVKLYMKKGEYWIKWMKGGMDYEIEPERVQEHFVDSVSFHPVTKQEAIKLTLKNP